MTLRTSLLAAALALGALFGLGVPPAHAAADVPAIKIFSATVVTATLPGAGTRSPVTLRVIGTDGSFLLAFPEGFAAGDVVKTGWQAAQIGELGVVALTVRGETDPWFPEYVQLYDKVADTKVTCKVGEWVTGATRFYPCR